MKKLCLQTLALLMILVLTVSSMCACGVPGSTTVTETPTEVSTEAPTEAPTEVPTEKPTAAPTEAPVQESPLDFLPEYTYDSYKGLWDVENGEAEMLVYTATSSDGYISYLTDLEKAGFTMYAENEIVGNLFSTWTKDDIQVTLMYIPSQKSTRILAEPVTSLPTRSEDNVYTDTGVENVVVQIGVNYDGQQDNGMCYAFRLCDGSFIIVDSGFNAEECADAIYETLTKLAPDPENIVIAAWFITHLHSDHTGGFYAFSDKYASKVKLEQLIYNYPTEKILNLCKVKNKAVLTMLPEYAESFEGYEVIEAHPGQEFYIRDAYVEMLFAWEMYTKSTFTYLNDSSLVFTVTINDTKTIMLGDCSPQTSPVIVSAYGDYLDSDYIQVAHHGYQGANAEMNRLIAAEVILWPAAESTYLSLLDDPRNKIFVGAEHLYIADTSATMITLPFDEEAVEIWELYGSNP